MASPKVNRAYRINNRQLTAKVRVEAQRTKRTLARRSDMEFPGIMPGHNVPLEHLNILVGRKKELGGAKLCALASLVLGAAAFTAASAIWFHKGLEIKGPTFAEFMLNPTWSMEYASVTAAGLVGAFFGWGIPSVAATLRNGNNGQQ